jgi:hypothetical protein
MGLASSRKRFVKRKLLTQDHFKRLSEGDPSKSYKYLEKMCEYVSYDRANIKTIIDEVKVFDFLDNTYLSNSDIQNIPNYLEFQSIIKDALEKKKEIELVKTKKNHFDIIVDDENYLIVSPHTEESSIKYGQGTKWCTSSKESLNRFDQYRKESTLYYIHNKKLPEVDPNHKIALQVFLDDKRVDEHWNAVDNNISPPEYIVNLKEKYNFKFFELPEIEYENEYERYGLDIDKIVFNTDGSIDYHGDVNLSNKKLTKIPFNFRNVYGHFDVSNNKLISLKGCPEKTYKFHCGWNQLVSLEHGPKSVTTVYNAEHNKLKNIDFIATEYTKCNIYLQHNEISSIDYNIISNLSFVSANVFYISYNLLEDVILKPFSFFKNLYFSNNKIKKIIDKALWLEFEQLDLSSNKLKKFGYQANSYTIHNLNLASNQIENITFEFLSVRNLNLNNNRIKKLKSILLFKCDSLYLSDNLIEEVDLENFIISTKLDLNKNLICFNKIKFAKARGYIQNLFLNDNPMSIKKTPSSNKIDRIVAGIIHNIENLLSYKKLDFEKPEKIDDLEKEIYDIYKNFKLYQQLSLKFTFSEIIRIGNYNLGDCMTGSIQVEKERPYRWITDVPLPGTQGDFISRRGIAGFGSHSIQTTPRENILKVVGHLDYPSSLTVKLTNKKDDSREAFEEVDGQFRLFGPLNHSSSETFRLSKSRERTTIEQLESVSYIVERYESLTTTTENRGNE